MPSNHRKSHRLASDGTVPPAADNTPPPNVEALSARTAARQGDSAPVEPLLVDADRAAAMCGISPASWYRLQAAGKLPAPVRLRGRVLWRVEDLRLWVSLGCPPRKEFEARKGASGRR